MNSDLQALLKDGEAADGGGGGGGGGGVDGALARLKTSSSAADKTALYEPKGMLKFIVQKVGENQ